MMSFDVEEKKASKCFLCDGDPKCVKACPAAAIRYIPWIDRTEDRPRRTTHGYYAQENKRSARSATANQRKGFLL